MDLVYLLDTNTCIHILKGKFGSPVVSKLEQLNPELIAICAPVEAELYYGAYHSAKVEKNLDKLQRFCAEFESLPFSSQSAQVCGQIRATLASQGQLIGPYDLQIAAIALEHDLTVVTHNVREFSRVESLKIEDWED